MRGTPSIQKPRTTTLYAILAIECDATNVYGVRQISFLFVIFANLSFGLFVCDRRH